MITTVQIEKSMSQEHNPADALLKKEENDLAERLKIDPFFSKMVREMLVDYVTNDFTPIILAEKYHISQPLVRKISNKFKFEQRKKDYDRKLLETVLLKAQKQQTALIVKITSAINTQVNRIIKQQEEDPKFIIPNSQFKELIASLTIFSKEYRLDNDKVTESLGFNVKVEFPVGVPVITENHKKTVEGEFKEIQQEVKEIIQEEQKKEEIDVKDESISNSDFFGMIES